jgi:hypothetical protein
MCFKLRPLAATLSSALVLAAAGLSALAAPPPPPISISLGNRDAHGWPVRKGYTHTGGGNIDVQQPSPDTLVITLTGVAVAGAHPIHDSSAQIAVNVNQDIEVSFDDPKVKRATLSVEGRVIGLLRTTRSGGLASVSNVTAALSAGGHDLITLAAGDHTINNGADLSINDLIAGKSIPILAGPFKIRQTLCISATHPHSLRPAKPASAEFAPDGALDPQWISYWEPFRGAVKKDFGFQIVVKVADDTANVRPIK